MLGRMQWRAEPSAGSCTETAGNCCCQMSGQQKTLKIHARQDEQQGFEKTSVRDFGPPIFRLKTATATE